MKKIAIISCCSAKQDGIFKAKELYNSPRFKKSYQYAQTINADTILILSAKFGLIHEDTTLETYDLAYRDLSLTEKMTLQQTVKEQLDTLSQEFMFDLEHDLFVVLAGNDYLSILNNNVRHIVAPIAGLPLGYSLQQLDFLNQVQHNNLSDQIHTIFNQAAKIQCYDASNFNTLGFTNGIYVYFQKDELLANGQPRIVRIGTHTGDGNLIARIRNHYRGKKESSIFRKNIGLCLLKQRGDVEYMKIWNAQTSVIEIRNKLSHLIDIQKEIALENEISDYLANNFYFVAFEVPTQERRLKIEQGLISALAYASNNKQSSKWLGNYSEKTNLLRSGMWLVKEMDKDSLNIDDLEYINSYFNNPITNLTVTTHNTSKAQRLAPQRNPLPTTKELAQHTLKSRVIKHIKELIDFARVNQSEDTMSIIIRSGDIKQDLRLNDRMPSICNAMRAVMKVFIGSKQVKNTIKNSTNLYIEYCIPSDEKSYQQIFAKLLSQD